MYHQIQNHPQAFFQIGTKFRIFIQQQNEYHFTDRIFDVMLCQSPLEDYPTFFMIISGEKAGRISFYPPKEAYYENSPYLIKKDWLEQHIFDHLNLSLGIDSVIIITDNTIFPFIDAQDA